MEAFTGDAATPFIKMHYQDLTGFGEHIDDLIANLQLCSGVVDLQPFFFRFTLATTTALIFGQPIKDYGNETQHQFASSFDYASLISATRIRLADFYWAYTPTKYRESCRIVKEYATNFIKQASETNKDEKTEQEEKYAFIRDLHDEYKDPILVRDQLVNVLIAGRDTTAALLSWTLYFFPRRSFSSDISLLKSFQFPPCPTPSCFGSSPTGNLHRNGPGRRSQPGQYSETSLAQMYLEREYGLYQGFQLHS